MGEADMGGPERGPARGSAGRIARGLGLVAGVLAGLIGAVAVLLVLAGLALNTAPGRRLVARELPSLVKPSNGLRVGVGRIDGSLYGRMVVHDLTLRDPQGVFLRAPVLTLAWEPWALARRRAVIDDLSAPQVVLERKPALTASKAGGGPSRVGIVLHQLRIDRFVLQPPVTGARRTAAISGGGELVRGRAILRLRAVAEAPPGEPAGDRLLVDLDAEPHRDRLQIAARLDAPRNGIVDGLLRLDAPLALVVGGHGPWRDWHGRAEATLGGQAVLHAALSSEAGRYGIRGSAQPGRVFPALARLAGPAVTFDVSVGVRSRRVSLDGRVASGAFAVQAQGGVDLKAKSFQALQVRATLTDPAALSPRLSGRDVQLQARLDGPFARPLVDYDLTAAALGYGRFGAEGLAAHGRSRRLANGAAVIPVDLAAVQVTGLRSAGPLLDVRLAGPLTLRPDRSVSGDLALRSREASARVQLAGSLRRKTFQGRLQARLQPAMAARLKLTSLTQGPVALGADFVTSPSVVLQLSHVDLTSPGLRIVDGQAALLAGGGVRAKVQAVSRRYGPIALTAAGTLQALRAHLAAPHPNLPLPVTGLQADLAPMGGGYRLTASGASPYGPVAVEALISTTPRLVVQLRKGDVAGLSLTGTAQRTAAGPFAGRLVLTGDGLDGALVLSAQGAAQAVAANLRADNARLPLTPAVTIRRGQATARAVLRPGGPDVTGRAALQGLSRGALRLTRARLDGAWRNGRGQATIAAAGDNGTAFAVDAQAGFAPGLVRISGAGRAAGVPLRLQAPAVARRQGTTWRLAPTTILLRRGRVELSGAYGKASGASAQVRLQGLDLRLLRALRPSLGLTGQLSGAAQLALPAGQAPSAQAALQITNLSRTTSLTVSQPLTVELLASLSGASAQAHGLVRRQGAVVGRVQASLALPAAGPLLQRLKAARVTGGVRYNGPADELLLLAGLSGQQLTGTIAAGLDVTGPLSKPQMRGVLLGRGLTYENETYGTRITAIDVDGQFAGDRLRILRLAGQTPGGGSISGSGYVGMAAAGGFPMDLRLTLDRAQLARSDTLGAQLGGTLAITNSRAAGGLVSGDLIVDAARYQAARRAKAQVVDLAGVHWKGQKGLGPGEAAGAARPPSRWKLDIGVHAPGRILVTGMGLDSEWKADLKLTGDIAHPRLVGDARVVRGAFSFAGRRLTLAGSSVIHFDGAEPPDPSLNISASGGVNGVTATVSATGTASHPVISFTSSPALPQSEVLSELLFGSSQARLSALQALQLAASLNALRGGGGLNPLARLSRGAGLENLHFVGADSATRQGPGVSAGKYISDKIYIDVLTDARGFTATQIEVALSHALSLISQVSTTGETSGSLRYTHRY